jgi:hypothetical protein
MASWMRRAVRVRRLKGVGSQDWLPHYERFENRRKRIISLSEM